MKLGCHQSLPPWAKDIMNPKLVRSTDFQDSRNQKPGKTYARQNSTTASLGKGFTLSWVTMAGEDGFTVVVCESSGGERQERPRGWTRTISGVEKNKGSAFDRAAYGLAGVAKGC